MPSVFERLRDALAPVYELERELGAGGMGVVFLARDTALERRVAIKIIRPELATARATERFLREARLLAQLKHPNIMPVHGAGEAGGFPYYVMDYCEEETLQARLARGPLEPSEAVRLGCQLLDGLETVHRAGLVHRDIKPANVFLLGDRAVLGDFGLTVPETVGTSAPTEPAGFVGTPGYTPPEQAAGQVVTARTDLYAVGVVLYEAVTCLRWYAPAPEEAPDWSRVPSALRPVLRRAVAWSPERRWGDAASFRRALAGRPRVPPSRWVVLGGTLAAAALLAWFLWPPPPDGSARRVHVLPFDSRVAGRPSLGDSLARLVAGGLGGTPEFAVLGPGDAAGRAAVELRGTVRSENDALCATGQLRSRERQAGAIGEVCVPGAEVVELADSLARLAMLALWQSREPLIADLPRGALPRTALGVAAWAQAEQLFNQGRWGQAYDAYLEAEQADTSCALCLWRLYFAENWMSRPHDQDRFQRFLAHIDAYPPQYRSVMRASALPVVQRLDTLRRATELYPYFFFAWWFYGEEQFHRAPLVGRWRREALGSFVEAAELSPTFAPAWEHLAFLATAEGDSAVANRALDQWTRAMHGGPRDPFMFALQAMITSGFAWRFRPGPEARAVTRAALLRPEVLASDFLAAGPRYMPMFDAPEGAVWLGGRFAEEMPDRPHLVRSGLLAQAFGYVALGWPDSARDRLDRLLSRFPDPELARFNAQYLGALAYLDPAGVPTWRVPGERDLLGDRPAADAQALVEGLRLARQERWREAVDRTGLLLADPIAPLSSPVLRALAHLERADWLVRLGNPQGARGEWRWAEHSHIQGRGTGDPQAADVDWSLRTLARWRLATVLDAAGVRDREVCLAYIRAAHAWSGGAPVFRARADSARQRVAQLSCPPGR